MSSKSNRLPRSPLSVPDVSDETLLSSLTVALLKKHFPLSSTHSGAPHKALRIRHIIHDGISRQKRMLLHELVLERWRRRHSTYTLQRLDVRTAANHRRNVARRHRSKGAEQSSSGQARATTETGVSHSRHRRLILSHIEVPPHLDRKRKASNTLPPSASTTTPYSTLPFIPTSTADVQLGSSTDVNGHRRSNRLALTKTVDISIADVLLEVGIPMDNLLDANDGDSVTQTQLDPEDLRGVVKTLLDGSGTNNSVDLPSSSDELPICVKEERAEQATVTRQECSSRAEFKMKRSFLRAQQHVDDRRSVYSSTGMDITDLSKKSAYRGYRKTADEPRSATIVPMEDGLGTEVYDCMGRLVLYRAFSPQRTPCWMFINDALTNAVQFLDDVRPCSTGGPRGDFKKYYFGLHRGSAKSPMMSVSYRDNKASVDEMLNILEPVRKICSDIFRNVFPAIYDRYTETIDFVTRSLKKAGVDVHALFYPWAAIGMNVGTVITLKHKDYFNYLTGLCLIIPFLIFDHKKGARLVVAELGMEFEIAAGIPILIPSACFTHYNTILEDAGMRNSFTAWTDGSIFLWHDLNGRSFSDLDAAEQRDFRRSMAERIARGFRMFPMRTAV